MKKTSAKFLIASMAIVGMSLSYSSLTFAAKAVDLSEQPSSILQSLAANAITMKETSRTVDFNNTAHVRMQQMYQGYPVLGADAVVHIANGGKTKQPIASMLASKTNHTSMDGTIYQGLNADLNVAHALLSGTNQAQKALQAMIAGYEHTVGGTVTIQHDKVEKVVYVAPDNKAHWAYRVSFLAIARKGKMPVAPFYVVDAETLKVYEQGNDIQTEELEDSTAGGFGGNEKVGEKSYDGLQNDLPVLKMERDSHLATPMCYVENAEVVVRNFNTEKVMQFPCPTSDDTHNKLYWDADLDQVNGGYSPSNDALYAGMMIKSMYNDWYHVPVLKDEAGKPMVLVMAVHMDDENAYYYDGVMSFGDGHEMFYPLTSLGVGAHEISHGFTAQHSNLYYEDGQSGGINEDFSDMAAQAAEYYAYGKNSWQIGPEIVKADKALRYMDDPTKDNKSIRNVNRYYPGLNVHYTSGIYNRVFYLLGTKWDTHKAFDVMVKANMDYWTSRTTFLKAACGVMKATNDYHYDLDDVISAFNDVGIHVDREKCLK